MQRIYRFFRRHLTLLPLVIALAVVPMFVLVIGTWLMVGTETIPQQAIVSASFIWTAMVGFLAFLASRMMIAPYASALEDLVVAAAMLAMVE